MKKAKTLPKLKAELQMVFNSYIRERDKDKPCISCGQYKPLQAGHFYTVKQYDGLRFDEDNVHGECAYCNLFDGMHLLKYAENLKLRIGKERFAELERRANIYKQDGHKWTRSELMGLIWYYKNKLK